MIKIIKDGDPTKNNDIQTFECANCGCIWEANIDSYTIGYSYDGHKMYMSICPNCKNREAIEE